MEKKVTLGLPNFEWKSVLKNFVIVLVGAALTYFTEIFTAADFGMYTELILVGWFAIVKIITKYIQMWRIARKASRKGKK